MRGYADSDKPSGVDNYTINKLTADLKQLILALGRSYILLTCRCIFKNASAVDDFKKNIEAKGEIFEMFGKSRCNGFTLSLLQTHFEASAADDFCHKIFNSNQ